MKQVINKQMFIVNSAAIASIFYGNLANSVFFQSTFCEHIDRIP